MHDKHHIYASDLHHRPVAEMNAERKEQAALEQAAVLADKERLLARQRSIDTPPATRIALWESRHGLAMPRDPKHPLMCVIAESTQLGVEQVLAEHQRRAMVRAGN